MEVITKAFLSHSDYRGNLTAIEGEKEISFSIKRVYYIYGLPYGVRRGFHAHKRLEQYLICIHGSCSILLDDGKEKTSIKLDRPDVGVYVGPGTWHEMFEFSKDAVLLTLASDRYNEEDYIRDYDSFLNYVRGSVK